MKPNTQGEKAEILEGNKLIAEFIGWRVEIFDSSDHDPEDPFYVLNQYDEEWNRVKQITGWEMSNISENELEHLPFETSWNWLMPVVEKIASGQFKMDSDYEYYKKEIDSSFINYKISDVYSAVIQFIKWYNKTTNHEN